MRSHALAALALALVLVPVGSFFARKHRAPAEPLACAHVVAIDDADGERLACPDDPALAKCHDVREGLRYRGCEKVGVVRGELLLMRGQPVDVDAASELDLRALPGIGEALGRRIVEARRSGPFCAPDDLHRVKGLGDKRIAALAPELSFGDPLCQSRGAK